MQAILRALNIEKGEETLVFLILLQSFFIGTFTATFDVAANALFFTSFGQEDLGKAYAFSAVAGMIFTYVYIRFQSSISFTKLAIINLMFISVLTVAMRMGFGMGFEQKQLIYAVFLLQGPLNTLAIVGFWGLMGRIFNLRQGKRLFGLVDSGQILGMIIILFSVPAISALMPATEDLIIISAGGIILSVVMQFVITAKYGDTIRSNEQSSTPTDAPKDAKKGISMMKMVRNPYIFMMVLFVMLAMLAQFFVHYSFLVVADQKYPDSSEFASFLAIFMGVLMIFTFAFKTFVFGKIIQMYGLRVTLLILPILLIFFTIIACISGGVFGYTIDSGGFMMFFLFIAISKLFAQSLRMAIEVPSFKLLYQPLDNAIKYDVQAKIDGTVNEFSALIGGLVLMGMSLISFVTLIDFSIVLAVVMLVYIYVAIKLYASYKDTLHQTLDSFKQRLKQGKASRSMKQLISSLFADGQEHKIVSTLKICKEVEPMLFEETLGHALGSKHALTNGFALNHIQDMSLTNYHDQVQKIAHASAPELSAQAQDVLKAIDAKGILQDRKKVALHLRSKKAADKLLLINEICNSSNAVSHLAAIGELLKDPNYRVRIAAIKAIGKLKEVTLLPVAIEYLDDPMYRNAVTETLLSLGEEMFEILNQSFYRSNFDSTTRVHIVNIFKKTTNPKVVPILLKKMNYPDQKVVNAALSALREFDFHADSAESVKVQQSIEMAIGVALWNMIALEEAEEYKLPSYLIEALRQERNDKIDLIYTLMSLLYDGQSITNIRQNIESGTAEGIGFALELLDLFVAEELKPKLFPLFDDISLDERIYRLELFYPIERMTKDQLLVQLINRDYNNINSWTKACALYTLLHSEEPLTVRNDYVAQLFNHDPMLYEVAALLLIKIDAEHYEKLVPRLSVDRQNDLAEFIRERRGGANDLLIEKGLLLLSNPWLQDLHGNVVAALSRSLEKYHLKAGQELSSVLEEYPLGIVAKGSLRYDTITLGKSDIFSDIVMIGSGHSLKAETDAELYVVDKEIFYDLLYLNDYFFNVILELVDNYYRQKV